jgi:hypothetical protein
MYLQLFGIYGMITALTIIAIYVFIPETQGLNLSLSYRQVGKHWAKLAADLGKGMHECMKPR